MLKVFYDDQKNIILKSIYDDSIDYSGFSGNKFIFSDERFQFDEIYSQSIVENEKIIVGERLPDDLIKIKELCRYHINVWKKHEQESGVSFKSTVFQTDENSQRFILAEFISASGALSSGDTTYSITWTDINNNPVPFTAQEFVDFALLVKEHIKNKHLEALQVKTTLESLVDVDGCLNLVNSLTWS